jgi:hypothetical protein
MTDKKYIRKDHEQPLATEKWGWRYHHLGIPTEKSIAGETYLPDYKIYFSGFNTSPFGIEWMRYEEGCQLHELVKTLPHLAFEVDDLDVALKQDNFNIIVKPNSPSKGVRVAMIEHNGAPIELIEFRL